MQKLVLSGGGDPPSVHFAGARVLVVTTADPSCWRRIWIGHRARRALRGARRVRVVEAPTASDLEGVDAVWLTGGRDTARLLETMRPWTGVLQTKRVLGGASAGAMVLAKLPLGPKLQHVVPHASKFAVTDDLSRIHLPTGVVVVVDGCSWRLLPPHGSTASGCA